MFRSSLFAVRSSALRAAQQAPLRRLAVGPSARIGALGKAAFATTRPARQDELDLYSPFESFGSQVAVQRPAPYFKGVAAVDGAFEDVSLTDYKGKWLVVLFYPMDFTFVCPTEILAFDRALPAFRELNTEVLAVSTDSEFSHLAWANMPRAEGGLGPDLKIPLFADKTHKMSRDYGVLLEDKGISLRGLFLIDPNGVTRQITINDLPVGRSVEETIRLVKAFQFTDKHGEVCPADWSPENSATIKPSPSESKSYFAEAAEKVKQAL